MYVLWKYLWSLFSLRLNLTYIVFLDRKWWISKTVCFCPFLFLMTIWETLNTEPSVPGLTSEKLAPIFKFIYKPWIIGFHSFLSLTNDRSPLCKLSACVLSLHSVSIWILFKCQRSWKCLWRMDERVVRVQKSLQVGE